MTIVSKGYAGTVMPNDDWANIQTILGSRYTVADHSSALVTATSDGSRQIRVAAGTIGGWGVLDQITAEETVTLDPVVSGTHYWLVVARRTWQTTQATSIAVVDAGTALPVSMPARSVTPGTVDDQPLALVKITPDGKTAIVYDLRAVGGPNFYNMSAELAGQPNWLSYMAFEGVTLWTGNKSWRRTIDPDTLNPTWDVDPEIIRSGPEFGNPLAVGGVGGWSTVSQLESRGTRSGNKMQLLLQAGHSSSSNSVSFTDAQGNVDGGDKLIMTVGNSLWHPPYTIPNVLFEYKAKSSATFTGSAEYRTDGTFVITAGVQGTDIAVITDGTWSIRTTINWIREN